MKKTIMIGTIILIIFCLNGCTLQKEKKIQSVNTELDNQDTYEEMTKQNENNELDNEENSEEEDSMQNINITDETDSYDWYQQMQSDSLISKGTNKRLENVMKKLENGESVTIVAIGGSVTEGAGASDYHESYADLVVNYLKEKYSNAKIDYLNIGLGGTSSPIGLLRYKEKVFVENQKKPDLVFIEFSVNDYEEPTKGRALECLIRTIMQEDNEPAVVLVFAVFKSKWNLQDDSIPIGRTYGLPMVSIKDGVRNAFDHGDITDDQYFSDDYHPTSYGHKIMADCITYMLSKIDSSNGGEVAPLPNVGIKLFSFMGLKLIRKDDQFVDAGGFDEADNEVHAYFRDGKIAFPDNWKHGDSSKNYSFTADLTCKNILLNYKTSGSSNFGKAEVYLDGTLVMTLDGHQNGGWNNSNIVLVLDEGEVKEHKLEIRMSDEDYDKCFTILAIGYTE